MKGYRIAVVLVALALIGTELMLSHIRRELAEFSDGFDGIEAHLTAGETEEAAALLDDLTRDWDEKREVWEMFLAHDTMDEMENSIYALRGYVGRSMPLSFGELGRLRAMLTELDMQTRFSWGHLL